MYIYLHDISRDVAKQAFAKLVAVERHGAFDSANALRECIDERGLAGAAGAHDGQNLAVSGLAGDAVQHAQGLGRGPLQAGQQSAHTVLPP